PLAVSPTSRPYPLASSGSTLWLIVAGNPQGLEVGHRAARGQVPPLPLRRIAHHPREPLGAEEDGAEIQGGGGWGSGRGCMLRAMKE
ncbi:MAG TPA: hypothetical protein VK458_12835, partial [Myxococcaceae bacterium]|nr:hypothetical protein [Myxococcaceae bacterium]